MIDTVILRLPERIHSAARVAAIERQMSLQEFISRCVDAEITGVKQSSPTAQRVARLGSTQQRMVIELVEMLTVAPDRYAEDVGRYLDVNVQLMRQPSKTLSRPNV